MQGRQPYLLDKWIPWWQVVNVLTMHFPNSLCEWLQAVSVSSILTCVMLLFTLIISDMLRIGMPRSLLICLGKSIYLLSLILWNSIIILIMKIQVLCSSCLEHLFICQTHSMYFIHGTGPVLSIGGEIYISPWPYKPLKLFRSPLFPLSTFIWLCNAGGLYPASIRVQQSWEGLCIN